MRHTFTNSERKAAACAQLWLFKYGLRLRRAGRAKALILGSLWHVLMSVWWKHKAGFTPQARWSACKIAADDSFSTLEHETDGFDLDNPSRINTHDLKDMRVLLGGMLHGYELRYGPDDSLTMTADELVLGHPTITASGNHGMSNVMGRVDKILVDSYGQHWIGEHKTSGMRLDDWRIKNGYDPQAPTYAWLLKHNLGIEVVGVCYDLAFKAVAPSPQKFKLAYKDSRLSKQLPANCTANALRNAIRFHKFREEDTDWYQDKIKELEQKPEPFFRREFVRFTPDAVERVGLELHSESTRLRGYQRRVDRAIEDCQDTHYSKDWRTQSIYVLAQVSHHYPRNVGACVNRYGRQCAFMDLCRHQSLESLAGLEQIPDKHRELTDVMCTCGKKDPKFNEPKFAIEKVSGTVTQIICIVCGKVRPKHPHSSTQEVTEATAQGSTMPPYQST